MGQFSSALLCLSVALVVISAPIPQSTPIVPFNSLTVPSVGGTFSQFETIPSIQSSETIQILQKPEKLSQSQKDHHTEWKRGFFQGLEGILFGQGCSHGHGGGCFIEDPSGTGSEDGPPPSPSATPPQGPPAPAGHGDAHPPPPPPPSANPAQGPPGPPAGHGKAKSSPPGHADVVAPL